MNAEAGNWPHRELLMITNSAGGETGQPSDSRTGRTEQLVEVSVFLFLIIPSLVFSFFVINQGGIGFVLTALSTIVRDLALVSLILFFVWRNRESAKEIGWTFKNGWKDIVLGIALFFPLFYGAAVLESVLYAIGFTAPPTPMPSFLAAKGASEILLAIVLVVVVALAEETIFRGYLILRFKTVTTNEVAAVLLSAIVFSLGHGYEGTAGVVTVGAIGVALALVYLWRKSLIAPITMHFLQDFVGIVLLPWLGIGK
jgi:membrane protease YdiL (CAAX protease family)